MRMLLAVLLLVVPALLVGACGPTHIRSDCAPGEAAWIQVRDLHDFQRPAGLVQVRCADRVVMERPCRYEARLDCRDGRATVTCRDEPDGPATIFEGETCR